jgi:diguanylate cyclase (GGDEF)-like protein
MEALLCRNDSERARLLDMSRRMRRAEGYAAALLILAAGFGVPLFGVLILVPLACAGVVFWIGQKRLDWVTRPELLLAGCWLFTQLMFACTVAVATGPRLYLLPLFMYPAWVSSVVFPRRTAALGVVFTAALMTATAAATDWHTMVNTPFALIYPLTAMLAGSIPAATVRDLDVQTRRTAIADPLTGTLNRVALESRVAELAHQTALTRQPVAVLIGDVDLFKAINDNYGHSRGDTVLREIASRLTATIGASTPVYRLGGEEFVVLLPGASVAEAERDGERLREAIAGRRIEGLAVTMSFGISGSAEGQSFDYERVFGAADGALYAAKRQGRDGVCSATSGLGDDSGTPVQTNGDGRPLRVERRRARGQTPLPAQGGAEVRHLHEETADRQAETGSLLVEDAVQRAHLVDLNQRLRETNRPAYALTFLCVLAAAPTYGWITVLPPVLAHILYLAAEHRLERFQRPEYVLGAMWLLAQGGAAVAIALVHFSSPYPPLFALAMMTILMTGSSGVFPAKPVALGTGLAILMTVGAGIAINPTLALHDPVLIILPAALVGAAGLVGAAAGRSAVDHRSAAVVDRLTGMLNRAALEARTAELAHLSITTGQSVAVIVADLDRFKSVNDQNGHATGDEVLQQAAYRIRKQLRAFDFACRVGGEEFAALLPGVTTDEATAIAHRMWEAIREEPIAGLPVTMSLGVAASSSGEPFEYQHVFERADSALYRAKQTGRDRVCCEEATAQPVAA